MAWTIYFLVGITVVTASAYKCKHSGYTSSDSVPRYDYQYGNQERIGIPAPHPSISDTVNSPDEVRRSALRIEEPTRRSGNGSKVLSWKPYPQSRRGQDDNNKIIFPGPTSDGSIIEIPEHCKTVGICEDVLNYPQEQANKIIEELGDTSMFQNDKLDLPEVPDITQRLGPQEENMELCNFQEKVVYPKAAIDSNGDWHVVLNKDDKPVQGFKVEICDNEGSSCSQIAIIQPGYKAGCKQKYTYRKMAVIENGTKLEKSLKVPSCCTCVARLDIQ